MPPADLAGGVRLSSLGGNLFTWRLLALLTESEMDELLGDPAAVASWCGRQLGQLAGLTAGPSRATGAAGATAAAPQRGRDGGVGLVAETRPAGGGVVERQLHSIPNLPSAPRVVRAVLEL